MKVFRVIAEEVLGNAAYDLVKPIFIFIVLPFLVGGTILLFTFLTTLDRFSLFHGFYHRDFTLNLFYIGYF